MKLIDQQRHDVCGRAIQVGQMLAVAVASADVAVQAPRPLNRPGGEH